MDAEMSTRTFFLSRLKYGLRNLSSFRDVLFLPFELISWGRRLHCRSCVCCMPPTVVCAHTGTSNLDGLTWTE